MSTLKCVTYWENVLLLISIIATVINMQLRRFGVSVPDDLLDEFDSIVEEKGYIGRSEAIRDAMRLYISKHKEEVEQAGGFASLSIVYEHKPNLMTKLIKHQHDAEAHVISTMHVHLTNTHCFEVLTIQGTPEGIKRLSNNIAGLSGIEYSQLFTFALPEYAETHTH